MRTQFQQQASEYDCAPVSFINALRYIFERSEFPPVTIKKIYSQTLDAHTNRSESKGSTPDGIEKLSCWLNSYKSNKFDVSSTYITGSSLDFLKNKSLHEKLKANLNKKKPLSAAILNVKHTGKTWHCITGLYIADNWLYCYDPYPRRNQCNKSGSYEFIDQKSPQSPNLRIDINWLNKHSNEEQYRLGTNENRLSVLITRNL